MDILLLGNGFDLYHKLPTKYINFLNTVKFLQENFNETDMLTIGKVFNDERLSGIDNGIKECYKKYYTTYSNFPLNIEDTKKLIELADKNVWFKYLSQLINKDITWIDFEKEIEKVVRAFEHYLENEYIEQLTFSNLFTHEANIMRIFNFFYYIVEEDFVGDTKMHRLELNEQFMVQNPLNKKSYLSKDKVISFLYTQLIELAEMLKLYLRNFVDVVVEKLKSINMIDEYIDLSQVRDVVTLNYTHTFESIYCKEIKRNIYHIHGDVDFNIVLGINSNENDNLETVNTDFLRFKKYYQRVFYKTDIEYLMALKYNDIFDSRNTNNLVVFGHSLDSTDKDIIMDLFMYSKKITIYCYNEKAMSDNIINLVNIYGREGFDILRSEKEMTFIVLDEI